MKDLLKEPNFRGTRLAVALLVAAALITVANATAADSAVAAQAPANNAPAVQFAPAVAEVLKLTEAKVEPGVVEAYVHSSQVPFRLSAAEIIALNQHGVSSSIITAMLNRSGELRAQSPQGQMPQAQPMPYPQAPVGQPTEVAPQVPYAYATEPAYAGYSYYPSTSYVYDGWGIGIGLGWPYWGWPYWGYRGYHGYRPYYGWAGWRGYAPYRGGHVTVGTSFGRSYATASRGSVAAHFSGGGRSGGFGGGHGGGHR